VATAPVQLCEPSDTRVTLTITINAGTGYVTTQQGAAAGVGLVITPQSPLNMTYRDWGDMLRQAWYGSADTNARLFFVADVGGQP
jgi:hypothetical protein